MRSTIEHIRWAGACGAHVLSQVPGRGGKGVGGLWTFDGHLMITILLPLIIMIMIMIDFVITIPSIIATIITITGDDDGDNGEV